MDMRTPRSTVDNHAVTVRPAVGAEFERCAEQMAGTDPWLTYKCSICWCTNGVMATPARLRQEIVAARHMLERVKERFGLQPASVTD